MRTLLAICFLALLCVAGWLNASEVSSEAKRQALESYQEASRLYLETNYILAIEALNRSLELDPRQPRVTRLLGICHQLTNHLEEAEKAFVRASDLEPKNAENWYLLGRLYYVQNFFGKALRALETASRLDGTDVRILECLALTYEALGDTEHALAAYGRAISWNGQRRLPSSTPHLNYGVLLHKLNRLADSETQLQLAKDLNPNDWQAPFELGKLYYARGRLEAASRELNLALKACTASSDDALRVRRLLALTYYRMGHEEDARKAIAAAEKSNR